MKIDDEKALNFRPTILASIIQFTQAHEAELEAENVYAMFLLELALANKIQVILIEIVAEQFTLEDEFTEAELKCLVQNSARSVCAT